MFSDETQKHRPTKQISMSPEESRPPQKLDVLESSAKGMSSNTLATWGSQTRQFSARRSSAIGFRAVLWTGGHLSGQGGVALLNAGLPGSSTANSQTLNPKVLVACQHAAESSESATRVCFSLELLLLLAARIRFECQELQKVAECAGSREYQRIEQAFLRQAPLSTPIREL